jgi:hypothetical protein
MQWSDISFAPRSRTLRQFAGLWLLCFAGLACWEGFRKDNPTAALVFAALALTVGPLGLLWPQAVRPLFVGWMVLAFPIGWTVSQVLLALLFYVVFTPVGLVLKLVGRDSLCRRYRPDKDTYWAPKTAPSDARSYFRQF